MIALDKSNSPVFITGIERSGSSLISAIIEMSGGFIGEATARRENIRIKELMNAYYRFLGVDHRGQYPLPDIENLHIPRDWKTCVGSALEKDGYNGLDLWMYKSARLAQIWPVWDYAYPDAKWIIVRRRTGDVIASCMKTDFMNAYGFAKVRASVDVSTEKEGWKWWVHHQEIIFRTMIENGINCKIIWPERVTQGNYQQIYEMLDWLNLPWNPKIPDYLEKMLHDKKGE